MELSKEDILHVADLSRLYISEEETDIVMDKLNSILQYINKLQEIDTSGVTPTTHAFSLSNAFRDDVVKESLTQNEALKNCACSNNETFIVPKII